MTQAYYIEIGVEPGGAVRAQTNVNKAAKGIPDGSIYLGTTEDDVAAAISDLLRRVDSALYVDFYTRDMRAAAAGGLSVTRHPMPPQRLERIIDLVRANNPSVIILRPESQGAD